MNKQEAKKRIDKLRKEISHHRYLYHVRDKQEISDAALDSLKNELFKLEMQFPDLLTPDSPTQRVGGKALEKFEKVEHSEPMLSLFDAFSREDMEDWEKRIKKLVPTGKKLDYFTELKLDGLAVALRYVKGSLELGATRGNGKIGENVTQNLKTFESIPLALRQPEKQELKDHGFKEEQISAIFEALNNGTIEVRGEAVMSRKVFVELNKKYEKEGKPTLANPRNGAAGSIRQLDPKLAAERKLDFFAYAVVTELGLSRHEQKIILAGLLGFMSIKHNRYTKDLGEVFEMHDYWDKHRGKLAYDCDGLVVKVNDLELWDRLGVVGKGPRYMMAYKFAAEQVTTILKGLEWQVGRTGVLTPTAVLEPVRVGGVTVAHATLHNMDEINRLDARVGDTVIIERAGDVIPKIVKTLPKLRDGKEKKIKPPAKCPQCGSAVERSKDEVAYRCVNKDCYAVQLRKLIHWASKGAMDIEGLGPKVIEQLLKEGLVNDPADFYTLAVGDLKPLERFADKSAENLVQSINEKKQVDLAKFIFALGIRHVGEESAIALAKEFRTLEELKKVNKEKIEEIYDFGSVMAKSVYQWFHDEINLKLLKKLDKVGIEVKKPPELRKNTEYKDKTFVLTGALDRLTRDEAKAKIRELGGKISSTVSKKTDYVVVGADPGSKHEKGKKLGVQIVGEDEFMNMIG